MYRGCPQLHTSPLFPFPSSHLINLLPVLIYKAFLVNILLVVAVLIFKPSHSEDKASLVSCGHD